MGSGRDDGDPADESTGPNPSLFEAVLDGTDAGVLVCDPTGEVRYANERGERLFGPEDGSLVGTAVADTLVTDVLAASESAPDSSAVESAPDAMPAALATLDEPRTFEGTVERGPDGDPVRDGGPAGPSVDAGLPSDETETAADPDGSGADDGPQRGSAVAYEVTAKPVMVGGDRYVVFTCRDVTERVHYERESSALDAIFESIPVYLYVKDEEGRHVRVSDVNPEAEEYLGKTDVEIFGEDGRETYEEDMRVVEQGEEVYQRESHDPEWNTFYLTSKVPWRDENGEIRGLIGVTHDLSEWKRHEVQLRRQNERLRTVASVISHDIRNPLQVAKGRLDFARERTDSENVDRAADAIDRMAHLLEELLSLVKNGQWVEDPETVSLEEVAESCWETATGDAGALEFEMDVTLKADPGRFQQLLENLFRNAVMHGGDDVTVRLGPLDSWAGFYVEDDGPGIPEDEREAVLESGYTTSEDGTGFGLAIVQVIAEAHGWNVAITESDAGGVSDERSESEARETDASPGARVEFTGVEWV